MKVRRQYGVLPLFALGSLFLSVLHYWLRIFLGAFLAVRASDNAREPGEPPSLLDHFLEAVLTVLSFPLTSVNDALGMTSFVGWPWMLNSLLWGTVVCYGLWWAVQCWETKGA